MGIAGSGCSVHGVRSWSECRSGRKGVPGRNPPDGLPTGQSRLDGQGQASLLHLVAGLGPVLELGHHQAGEELEGLADILVAIPPGLADEDQLVHTGVFVGPHQFPEAARSGPRSRG